MEILKVREYINSFGLESFIKHFKKDLIAYHIMVLGPVSINTDEEKEMVIDQIEKTLRAFNLKELHFYHTNAHIMIVP